MQELLLQLLVCLESVGEQNKELYDSDVRDRLGDALFFGFVRPLSGFELPLDFGLYSIEANHQVRTCLGTFISDASELANKTGLSQFHERLQAIQNPNVATPLQGNRYDDFLGHTSPDLFNERGESLGH